MTRRIAVLGSTGSVGVNALRIAQDHRDRFDVVALAARRSAAALRDQAREHGASAVCLVDGDGDRGGYATDCAVFHGADGVVELLEATQPDLVLNAITGAAGLPASEWTLARGRTLALANKESFVIAGGFLKDLARETGATVLPVDSEHCAVFQCLNGERRDRLRRIFLTASGGPFRTRDLTTFDAITPAEALRHPTWDMGPRITIGSATMMNKAFEVVEAHWLFNLAPEEIEVVIHPQSIVHSMVEFLDGSIMAQLGVPDMRVPILYCLGWPDRLPFDAFEPFDPVRFSKLEFQPVEAARFPAIELAFETLRKGGDTGAVLNAADEELTAAFLDGRIDFPAITRTVGDIVRAHRPRAIHSLADVERADREGREAARASIAASAAR